MAEYMHIKAQFDINLHDSVRKLFKMSHFIKFVATDLVIFRISKIHRFHNLLKTFFFLGFSWCHTELFTRTHRKASGK